MVRAMEGWKSSRTVEEYLVGCRQSENEGMGYRRG